MDLSNLTIRIAQRRRACWLLQEGAPFHDGWKSFLGSLPWASWLFLAAGVVDVLLVWAYCGWAVNRPNGSIEESLHIALALAVRAHPQRTEPCELRSSPRWPYSHRLAGFSRHRSGH